MLPGDKLSDLETRYFCPLFVTFDMKKKRLNSHRLDNAIVTKNIRHHVNAFMEDTQPKMSEVE